MKAIKKSQLENLGQIRRLNSEIEQFNSINKKVKIII